MVARLLKYCLLTAVVAVFAGISTSQIALAQANNNNNNPNPPGNNGFVKVNDDELDNIPNNDPHVACQFRLDFYNYDLSNTYADVQFELQAPTDTPAHTLAVSSGDLHPFIGGDAAGGSNDLDASETYALDFTGTPEPNQGYHVKLTINAPGTNGSDVKHKTFWVEPCTQQSTEVAPELSIEPVCEQRGQSDGVLDVAVTNPNDDPVTYTVTAGSVAQDVTVAGHDSVVVTFNDLTAGSYTVTAAHGNFSTSADARVDLCPEAPQNPSVNIQPGACVAPNGTTGAVTVQLTNPNAYDVNYEVTVEGVTQSLTLAGGASGSLTFTGLTAGTHSVEVVGDNDTSATADATLLTCSSDCTVDCGGRGGDDTPPIVLATTTPTPPAATPTPPAPVLAQLADTGMPLLTPYAIAITLVALWTVMYKRPKVATQSAQ